MTKYILMVFAGACSFGILSTLVKLSYQQGYTAADISASQAFTGMLVLWAWVWLRIRKKQDAWQWPLLQACGRQVLLTGVFIGLTTFVYYRSVQYITASLAIILLMQFTWMGVLLDRLLFGNRPQRMQLLSIAVIIGATILASGITEIKAGVDFLKGSGYALLSAFLYAGYIVANSRYGNELPAPQKSALIMTGSTMAIVLVNLRPLATGHHIDTDLVKWALLLAVFGTIIPPVLFARGIPRIGAGLSAIIMTAELPVAIICAHLILQEPLSALQWAGIILLLLAIVCMNLWKKSRQQPGLTL